MWPTSPQFAAAILSGNQRVVYKIECLLSGAIVFSTTAVTFYSGIGPLPSVGFAISGNVSVDTTTSVGRRKFDIEIVDPGATSAAISEIAQFLDIFGQEIRLYRGLLVPSGPGGSYQPEYIPIGTFRMTDVEKVEQPALTIKLRGTDRALALSQQAFIDPYPLAAGINNGAAIQTIVQAQIPWLPCSPADFSTATTVTTTATTFPEGDTPWAAATLLAEAAGLDLYFDPMGTLILTPTATSVEGPVVAQFVEGQYNTAITIGDRDSSTAARSACVVSGESTGLPAGTNPPRAVVYDTDPTSSTYYLGPFGIVPDFYRSALVQSNDQATAMATARLQLLSGRAQRLDISAIPNPAFEGNDLVYAQSKTIAVSHLLMNFTMPLSPAELMTIGSRKKLSLR